jgi:hypothetical protein
MSDFLRKTQLYCAAEKYSFQSHWCEIAVGQEIMGADVHCKFGRIVPEASA